MNYNILINKDHLLAKDYFPLDLVETDQNENNFHQYLDPTLKPKVCLIVYQAFLIMQKEALKQGYQIIIDSGYRSNEYQEMIYKNTILKEGLEVASKKVAPKYASEHASGLAIDIAFYKDGVYCDNLTKDDKEAIWLFHNAYKYGFILRYPEGKEDVTGFMFEPWHYRYIEKDLAKYLYDHNLVLDEYLPLKRIKK